MLLHGTILPRKTTIVSYLKRNKRTIFVGLFRDTKGQFTITNPTFQQTEYVVRHVKRNPTPTRAEIFSESYWITQKSDCIYHFHINLEYKRTRPFVFQINRKMVNTIWFRFALMRFRKDLSVHTKKKTKKFSYREEDCKNYDDHFMEAQLRDPQKLPEYHSNIVLRFKDGLQLILINPNEPHHSNRNGYLPRP